jgi:hypothetical protein
MGDTEQLGPLVRPVQEAGEIPVHASFERGLCALSIVACSASELSTAQTPGIIVVVRRFLAAHL